LASVGEGLSSADMARKIKQPFKNLAKTETSEKIILLAE
jgi:hypothetical protein